MSAAQVDTAVLEHSEQALMMNSIFRVPTSRVCMMLDLQKVAGRDNRVEVEFSNFCVVLSPSVRHTLELVHNYWYGRT